MWLVGGVFVPVGGVIVFHQEAFGTGGTSWARNSVVACQGPPRQSWVRMRKFFRSAKPRRPRAACYLVMITGLSASSSRRGRISDGAEVG